MGISGQPGDGRAVRDLLRGPAPVIREALLSDNRGRGNPGGCRATEVCEGAPE